MGGKRRRLESQPKSKTKSDAKVSLLGAAKDNIYMKYIYYLVYINDLIVAVETAKQGPRLGKVRSRNWCLWTTSRRYQEHPKDYRNIEKALEYTRKWGVTVNVKKCAAVVCMEEKVNPVKIQLEMGRK